MEGLWGAQGKGGHVPVLFSNWFFSGCQVLRLEFYFQVKRTSYALENTVLKKNLRISKVSVCLYYIREKWEIHEAWVSPWSVGSKCIDSLCQVVRILQDVSASSPPVLFSQDRTPKSIAQSPLPPCPLVVIIVSMSRLFGDVMVRRCIVVCHAYTHLNQQWDESMAHLAQTPRARRMLLMGKGSSCWKCAFCSS